MARPVMTAQQVRGYLYGHFTPRWAVLFEVTARPEGSLREKLQAAAAAGDSEVQTVYASHRDRRIDALLVRRTPKRTPSTAQVAAEWNRRREEARAAGGPPPAPPEPALFDVEAPSPPGAGDDGGIERLALEIKVTRSDFLADVRCPEKQGPWRELANRHAYVCPAGLVSPAEVPKGSGLLEINPNAVYGTVKWTRKAPRSEAARPLPLPNLMDAFYRAARAEALARGVDWQGRRDDADEETMRAELARLRHEYELLENRVYKAEQREAEWRRRVAAFEPMPCSTCGQPLRPALRRKRLADSNYVAWQHTDAAADDACHALRKTLAESEPGADLRYGLYVPAAEPLYPEETTSCVVTG